MNYFIKHASFLKMASKANKLTNCNKLICVAITVSYIKKRFLYLLIHRVLDITIVRNWHNSNTKEFQLSLVKCHVEQKSLPHKCLASRAGGKSKLSTSQLSLVFTWQAQHNENLIPSTWNKKTAK